MPAHWFRSLPNMLTACRLCLLPLLWYLALTGRTAALALGICAAGATDVLDGALARRYGLTSPLGSRLDSFVDHLLSGSILLWLTILRPEFVRAHTAVLTAWLGIGLASLAVGWMRFRQLGNLHLYSAKVAGTLGYLFAVNLLFTGSYPAWFFYLAMTTGIVAAGETLAVFALSPHVHERIGSILLRKPPRSAGPAWRSPERAARADRAAARGAQYRSCSDSPRIR